MNKRTILLIISLFCAVLRVTAQTENYSCAIPSEICGMGGTINGKAVNLPKPEYPPDAKSLNSLETVVVKVETAKDGKVVAAKAVSGNSLFYAETENADLKSRFSATFVFGESLAVGYIISYKFNENREVTVFSVETLPLKEEEIEVAKKESYRKCAEAYFRIKFDEKTWSLVENLRKVSKTGEEEKSRQGQIEIIICIDRQDKATTQKLKKIGFKIQKRDVEKHLIDGKIRLNKFLALANLPFVRKIFVTKK